MEPANLQAMSLAVQLVGQSSGVPGRSSREARSEFEYSTAIPLSACQKKYHGVPLASRATLFDIQPLLSSTKKRLHGQFRFFQTRRSHLKMPQDDERYIRCNFEGANPLLSERSIPFELRFWKEPQFLVAISTSSEYDT